MWSSVWVVLCASAYVALAAGDGRRTCLCTGILRRTADCSHRERSSFDKGDLCAGRTTKVDLSHNNFRVFPPALGAYVSHVNVSHNQLTALPRAPPLNVDTNILDVSFNLIANSGNELRTLSSLHALSASNNRLSSLNFLPDPCALRRLNAKYNLLRVVPKEINRCEQLNTLELSGNPLRVLSAAFARLRHLEYLSLARDEIRVLQASCFKGLEKLILLDLAHNKLPALYSNVFSPLKNLRELYLDNNTITEVFADAFQGLSKLELLGVQKNYLKQFPRNVFSPLKNLKYLQLNENQLITLSSNVFSGLVKIDSISLSHNRLETLPARLFAHLPTLRVVALDANDLKMLPPDMLVDVERLNVLDLSNNRLNALPDGLFHGVRLIKMLNLSHNRFASFDGSALAGLERVDRLDLQHNALTTVPAYNAASWPSLGHAYLGENRVEEVTEAQLRAWLGSGHHRRALVLGARPPLRSVDQLVWALHNRKVFAATRGGCACGFLKKRFAEVSFCTAAPCPEAVVDWIDAAWATARG